MPIKPSESPVPSSRSRSFVPSAGLLFLGYANVLVIGASLAEAGEQAVALVVTICALFIAGTALVGWYFSAPADPCVFQSKWSTIRKTHIFWVAFYLSLLTGLVRQLLSLVTSAYLEPKDTFVIGVLSSLALVLVAHAVLTLPPPSEVSSQKKPSQEKLDDQDPLHDPEWAGYEQVAEPAHGIAEPVYGKRSSKGSRDSKASKGSKGSKGNNQKKDESVTSVLPEPAQEEDCLAPIQPHPPMTARPEKIAPNPPSAPSKNLPPSKNLIMQSGGIMLPGSGGAVEQPNKELRNDNKVSPGIKGANNGSFAIGAEQNHVIAGALKSSAKAKACLKAPNTEPNVKRTLIGTDNDTDLATENRQDSVMSINSGDETSENELENSGQTAARPSLKQTETAGRGSLKRASTLKFAEVQPNSSSDEESERGSSKDHTFSDEDGQENEAQEPAAKGGAVLNIKSTALEGLDDEDEETGGEGKVTQPDNAEKAQRPARPMVTRQNTMKLAAYDDDEDEDEDEDTEEDEEEKEEVSKEDKKEKKKIPKEKPKPTVCKKCQGDLGPDDKFCKECGAPTKEIPKPPIDIAELNQLFCVNLMRKGTYFGSPIDDDRLLELQILLGLAQDPNKVSSDPATPQENEPGVVGLLGEGTGQDDFQKMRAQLNNQEYGENIGFGGGLGAALAPLAMLLPSIQQSMMPSAPGSRAESAAGSVVPSLGGSVAGSRRGSFMNNDLQMPQRNKRRQSMSNFVPSGGNLMVPGQSGSSAWKVPQPRTKRSGSVASVGSLSALGMNGGPPKADHVLASTLSAPVSMMGRLLSKAPEKMQKLFNKYEKGSEGSVKGMKLESLAEELEFGLSTLEARNSLQDGAIKEEEDEEEKDAEGDGTNEDVVRKVRVVALRIMDCIGGRVLVQKWQRDQQGQWRQRNALPGTKWLAEEEAFEAADRILSTDLGILQDSVQINASVALDRFVEEKESRQYPGLWCEYDTAIVEAVVVEDDKTKLKQLGLGGKKDASFVYTREDGVELAFDWMDENQCLQQDITIKGNQAKKVEDDASEGEDSEEEDDVDLLQMIIHTPNVLVKDLVRLHASFREMSLHDLACKMAKTMPAESIAPDGEQRGFEFDVLRRDSCAIDQQQVTELLTMLNGGQAPRRCTCKPGQPHTCMTPAASVLASLMGSVQHSMAGTVANSMMNSRRGSFGKDDDKKSPKKAKPPPVVSKFTARRGSLGMVGEVGSLLGPSAIPEQASPTLSEHSEQEADSDDDIAFAPKQTISGDPMIGDPTLESGATLNFGSFKGGRQVSTESFNSNQSSGSEAGFEKLSSDGSNAAIKKKTSLEHPLLKRLASIGNLGEKEYDLGEERDKFDMDDELAVSISECEVLKGFTIPGFRPGKQRRGSEAEALDDGRRLSISSVPFHRTTAGDVGGFNLPHIISRSSESATQSRRSSQDTTGFDTANNLEEGLRSPSENKQGAGANFEYIPPESLADVLGLTKGNSSESSQNKPKVLVIDVRGRDFKGGHIAGGATWNFRSSEVCADPGRLLEICRSEAADSMVFTCMYSLLRAVRCARAVQDHQRDHGLPLDPVVPIKILEHGFHGWVNYWHKQDNIELTSMIADFDSNCWQDCSDRVQNGKEMGLVHSMDAVWSEGGQKELALALEDALQGLAV